MIHLTLLLAASSLLGAGSPASPALPPADTVVAYTLTPVESGGRFRIVEPDSASGADTVRRRPRAVDVSDAYALRLRIHRYASYTMIPLFAVQSIAGNQLYQSRGPTPAWAKSLHSVGAGGLATLFTVNTVTGVWNLWDSRSNPAGRTRRWVHAGLMLASDAGFTYAGVKLGPDATRSREKQTQHRRVALISMSGALLGYSVMLFGNR
jgi:hypothetical protein